MGGITPALILQLDLVSTSLSSHVHWDLGTRFWVSVIICITPTLLGDLSLETNTEKWGEGRTYGSQNKLQTLFPQYKEFLPICLYIVKSWGQNLAPHESPFLECPWNFTHSS